MKNIRARGSRGNRVKIDMRQMAESVVKAAGCRVPFTSARVQAFPGAKPGENFLKEISTHLLTVLTTGAILAS